MLAEDFAPMNGRTHVGMTAAKRAAPLVFLGCTAVYPLGCSVTKSSEVATSISENTDALLTTMCTGTPDSCYDETTTPHFRETVPKEEFFKLSAQVANLLGEFRTKQQVMMKLSMQPGRHIATAEYNCQFQKSIASVAISFQEVRGRWLLYGVRVRSPAFDKK